MTGTANEEGHYKQLQNTLHHLSSSQFNTNKKEIAIEVYLTNTLCPLPAIKNMSLSFELFTAFRITTWFRKEV